MSKSYCSIKGCSLFPLENGRCWKHQTSSLPEKEIKANKKPNLRKISDKRKEESKEYEKIKKAFLKGKVCDCCGEERKLDVHHAYGRVGKGFMDESTWKAVCRTCHTWIHSNPLEAEQQGLLATTEQKTEYERLNSKTKR